MEDATAWMISRRVNIPPQDRQQMLTIRIPPPGKPTVQQLYRLGADSIGPRVQLTDQEDAGRWVLITHGGFFTYQHHDAEGFCTHMEVTCGGKIWAILDPDSIRRVKVREELWEVMDEVFQRLGRLDSQEQVAGTLLLEPGDVL
jgi:hypothetical protein